MINFFAYLVLPLLIMLVIGVLWWMLMCWVGSFNPMTARVAGTYIRLMTVRLVTIAIWRVIAYLIFEVL